MRACTFRSALLLALAAATGLAAAQSTEPPKLEQLNDADTPITVTPKESRETTTKVQRQNGRIVQETVQAGGSTYTVKPNNATGGGTSLPGDAGGTGIRGAQWTVMEFDIAKKQKQRSADAAAAAENAEDAPPPPPPPPAKR